MARRDAPRARARANEYVVRVCVRVAWEGAMPGLRRPS